MNKQKLPAMNSTYPQTFERLAASYPRKEGAARAYKVYKKIARADDQAEQWIRAIEEQKRHKAWLAKQNKFIPDWPHLSTWLNAERWNDQIPSHAEHSAAPTKRHAQQCQVVGCESEAVIITGAYIRCAWHHSREQAKPHMRNLHERLKASGLDRQPGESSSDWADRCRAWATAHNYNRCNTEKTNDEHI